MLNSAEFSQVVNNFCWSFWSKTKRLFQRIHVACTNDVILNVLLYVGIQRLPVKIIMKWDFNQFEHSVHFLVCFYIKVLISSIVSISPLCCKLLKYVHLLIIQKENVDVQWKYNIKQIYIRALNSKLHPSSRQLSVITRKWCANRIYLKCRLCDVMVLHWK